MGLWATTVFRLSESGLLHSNLPGSDWLVGREGDGWRMRAIISSLLEIDNRKKAIWTIILLFMIVTTFHVAFYAASFEKEGSAALSWPYAIGVDLAVIVCSFFTRWQTTKAPAWTGYFTFTLMSGAMNIGWIKPGWDIAAISYAVFPTIAIALLGWLFRQVDKLTSIKPNAKASQSVALPTQSVVDALKNEIKLTHLCEYCHKGFGSRFALSAHLRGCKAYKASHQVAVATQSEEIATHLNGHQK